METYCILSAVFIVLYYLFEDVKKTFKIFTEKLQTIEKKRIFVADFLVNEPTTNA